MQATEFGRPAHLPGRHVEFEAADAGDALSHRQLVLAGFQHPLGAEAFGDVLHDHRQADDVAVRVEGRRRRREHVDQAAVLAPASGLVALGAAAGGDARPQPDLFV